MGDVPGLGLSFVPFAAPRWICPESDDDDDEEEEQLCYIPAYGPPPFGLYGPYGDPLLVPPRGFTDADSDTRGLSAAWRHRVTAEEAEKNAMELLAEEERMKRKAEKKKLKKKKQKDRRKQERLEQELRSKRAAASEELDLNCTFIFKAWQKAGVKLPAPARDKAVSADAAEPNKRLQEGASKPEPAPLDTNMLEQSWILAGCGNQAAMQGRYKEAVQAFTEAIKLNPREHRLFGNRSYCYEKLQQYQEALRDAEMALELQPNWPKGFFRKGKALWGLKRYAEARDTFKNLEGAHADVATQMEACRLLLQQSNLHDASSPRDVPVLEAGEPLTPTSDGCVNGSCSDVDTGGFVTVVNSRSHSKSHVRTTTAASPKHTLPSQHPARDCYPLWVGNITFQITKKVLQSCFSRFGQIQSIRTLPERHCAFINFQQKAAAEAAYRAMLGADLEGCRLALQLKHPSHATPPPRQRP
ncbi:hypothetical protein CIB84_014497 [Bambusicola thoracicus]|uniref:RRM domain-containing protein n=1 Tax=Bambusicola thoracicus TaxID=9083 RepID=A0A2P4SCC1_BAMTH|nr:hypothetical protein CIB84_014497 [Bambusicola thoracicus]